jgi:hypothetical protein
MLAYQFLDNFTYPSAFLRHDNVGLTLEDNHNFLYLLLKPHLLELPYIIESNPHLVFAIFLNEKKLVRASNPHLSFNRPLPV